MNELKNKECTASVTYATKVNYQICTQLLSLFNMIAFGFVKCFF